ncbi:DUF3515 domain-containing protein [Streptomyces sp. NPDC060194]|uniref:DUF3515 domain-containing protein n=1 Tax=Streptomyces sp. NPDC060194 TaxID=3347069 RepID=UPI00364FFA3A
MTPNRRRPAVGPALLVSALALGAAGCAGDPAAKVAVPSPTKTTARLCGALDRELPSSMDGAERSDPEPASGLTAAWDGGIVLRCGVPQPADAESTTARSVEVDGVSWLTEERSDGSYRFTAILREAYVEVTLPAKFPGGAAPLVDLAPAVSKAIPEGVAPADDGVEAAG